MSDLGTLFQEIESERFSALVNVASNLKTFLRALDAQPETGHLAALMASEDITLAVNVRALDRIGQHVSDETEHVHDSAIAAYLWLLSSADPSLAVTLAEGVIQVRNLWWARKVAESILSTTRPPIVSGVARNGEQGV